MLRNISTQFSPFLSGILFYSRNKSVYSTKEKNLLKSFTWDLIPMYPMCQYVDFHDYVDMDVLTPLQLQIEFNKVENSSVTVDLLPEERLTRMRRTLKSKRTKFIGPPMSLPLKNTIKSKYFITISQTIHSERDTAKPCRNYPTEEYESYEECDRLFVYKKMIEKYNMVPFWSAESVKTLKSIER